MHSVCLHEIRMQITCILLIFDGLQVFATNFGKNLDYIYIYIYNELYEFALRQISYIFCFKEENCMRIVIDTDKKTVTVPWNYAAKLEEMNRIIKDGGGDKQYTFSSYLKEIWAICMEKTDKSLIVADKPARAKK